MAVLPLCLEGWGRYKNGVAYTAHPELERHFFEILSEYGSEHILAIGNRRSYGDACLNTGNVAVFVDRFDHAIEFDVHTGIFTCEAGITIQSVVETVLPKGWFLPVTPGTKFPTLGGCFAADVHGKNHHHVGSFSRHVRWIDLMTASGEILHCSPEDNSDIFQATAGGMGLTGFILRISIQLIPVESAYIYTRHLRANDLIGLMQILSEHDNDWQYTVAWVDCSGAGESNGRGIVSLGRHALSEELPIRQQVSPYRVPYRSSVQLPFVMPVSMVNRMSSRIFNKMYFGKDVLRGDSPRLVSYDSYFYPLDSIGSWNRLYGKRGFLQYQFVVPFDGSEQCLSEVLKRCIASGFKPSLAVLKRFGDESEFLSFPKRGWTFALDFAIQAGLLTFLDNLDQLIVDYSGRIYLAKDARMKAETFERMYPDLNLWRDIKYKIDPRGVFSSDLSRRLKIFGESK